MAPEVWFLQLILLFFPISLFYQNHPERRESLGLDLKNNIIIIDEAHNLADSLISMYDSKITLFQLIKK